MTKKVLKLDNGEIAVVDSKNDETLFDAYYINGVEQEDGTDVKLHVTKKGEKIKMKVSPKCPQCGAFLTPTKAGWHGTPGADLAGTGIEYYCKRCGLT